MKTDLPWQQITEKASDTRFKLIRIDAGHALDFYWGKDADGRFLLVLKMAGMVQKFLHGQKFILAGITSDFRKVSDLEYVLVLSLQDASQADLFYKLCIDLVESSRECRDEKAAADIIITRLKRWQAFLSRKKRGMLSSQDTQGLFSEICLLEECVSEKGLPLEAALQAWLGPKDAPQDFIFGSYAVEVKSVCGSCRNTIRISSENQLSTHLENLFLHVFYMVEDENSGESLNDLINRLKAKWQRHDPASVLSFDEILQCAGYIELQEYDHPRFRIIRTSTYLVTENFPRITPATLPAGIKNVSYDIELHLLAEFESTLPNVEEG